MKRAQASIPLLIIIAAALVIFILIFGSVVLNKVMLFGCKAELEEFKLDIEQLALGSSASTGTLISRSLRVPCEVEKIVFFDDNKYIPFAGFSDYPLIMDSLHSNVKKNMFLIKHDRVVDALYIPKIDVKIPYFICANTRQGWLHIDVESDDGKSIMYPHDLESDCTYDYVMPVELSIEDALYVIGEIFRANQSKLNMSVVDPESVDLTKSISYEGNWTVINITKSNGTFEYYESIPKCVFESFIAANASGVLDLTGAEGVYNLSDDPLIMWEFEEEDIESLEYKIKGIIDPECLRGHSPGLFSLGLSTTSYPSLNTSDATLLKEKRKERGLPPMDLLRKLAVLKAREIVMDETESMIIKLNDVYHDIRKSSIPVDKRLDLMEKTVTVATLLETDAEYSYIELKALDAELIGFGYPALITNEIILNGARIADYQPELEAQEIVLAGEPLSCTTSGSSLGTVDVCDNGVKVKTDECYNDTMVAQVGCSDTACVMTRISCGLGLVCVGGACMAPPPACYDSDEIAWYAETMDKFIVTQIDKEAAALDLCSPIGSSVCYTPADNGLPKIHYDMVNTRLWAGNLWFNGSMNVVDDEDDIVIKKTNNGTHVCFENQHAQSLGIAGSWYRLHIQDSTGGAFCDVEMDNGMGSKPPGLAPASQDNIVCCPYHTTNRGVFLKGTVFEGGESKTDYCKNSAQVKEYYCDGPTRRYNTTTCPVSYSCERGACRLADACEVKEDDEKVKCYENNVFVIEQQCRSNEGYIEKKVPKCDATDSCIFNEWYQVGTTEDCHCDGDVPECTSGKTFEPTDFFDVLFKTVKKIISFFFR